MTNYEKIKQMSIEEMAIMLDSFHFNYCNYCPAYYFCNEGFENEKCINILKQWLESEVEE